MSVLETMERVRNLQVACLRLLLVLQAFYLINGYPTVDESGPEQSSPLDPYTNFSRADLERTRASGGGGGGGDGGGQVVPPVYQHEDPAAEKPTLLSSSTRIKIAPKSPDPPDEESARTASSLTQSNRQGNGGRGQDSFTHIGAHHHDGSNHKDDPPPWRDPDFEPEPVEAVLASKTGKVRKSKNKNRHRDTHSDYNNNRNKDGRPSDPWGVEEDLDGEDGEEEIIPVEQRLMNHLMRHYERSVRPVKNASETVLVRMGLTLTQIFDMDEKNQVLVTNVWLDQEWDDMFLTWVPEEYGGLKVLRLPCHKLWLPDIVLYNNAAEYTDGLMPANAMITYEGNVFWPVPTKLQSTCKVDVTYFPFDEQYCRLKFGSWTYDGFQVDMVNRTMEVDLSNYVENGEWELMSISVQRNVVFYACCPEPFPDVTFIIHIRRRTLYYMYNVIFPCIMMSTLTLLVFCLPPDSGEKVTMGITVLLAFSVFMLTIAEDLPETSEFIPLLSIYLTIVMAMTSVSVIMTVFVLNLHHRGPNNKPVPAWLRRLLLRRRVVKRGLCFSKQPLLAPPPTSAAPSVAATQLAYTAQNLAQPEADLAAADATSHLVDEYLTDGHSNYIKNVSLRLTIENLAQELKEELDNCTTSTAANTGGDVGEFAGGDHINIGPPPPPPAGTPSMLGGFLSGHHELHPGGGQYHELPQSDSVLAPPAPAPQNASILTTAPPLSSNSTTANRRPAGLYTKHACTKTNEEILNALKKIIERYERDDSEEEIMYEWRQVALAVDRVLFWIFLFGTLASTIVVLIVAPITKWL